MKIRPAEEADLPRILEIYAPYVKNTAYSFEYTVPEEEEFRQRFLNITKQFPWLVAEENGMVLGYAYASAPFTRAAYQWCSEVSVYLAEDQRGKGLGKMLYSVLENLLKAQGYQRIYAVITSENHASLAFHQACGYEFLAEFPGCGFKLGCWHGVTWLQKVLKSVELPMNPPISFPELVQHDRKIVENSAKIALS